MQNIYSSDAPILDPEMDQFGRYPFAQRISQTIISRQEASCLVLAIYGKWGEGKTTVLNFIENGLREESRIVPIQFNPWRYLSEQELISSFYSTLAENLGRSLSNSKEKVGDWIQEYLTAPAAIFDRSVAAKEFGYLLSKVQLEELRDRICKILREENKTVVVLIDDIDRLDKIEIHSIFRLVKLSANFEKLVYILAFDDEMVADALQEKYGTNNTDAGKKFLEKIIQVPLNLPIIEHQSLRNFCFKGIDEALKQANIELSVDDVHHFVSGFSSGIEIQLKTPRMAIRYINALKFSLSMVRGEVNIVDFLLIEAIRVFYPDIYSFICNSQEVFLGKSLEFYDSSQVEKDKLRKIVDKIFIDVPEAVQGSIKGLLISLFPRLQSIYGNTSYLSEWDKRWETEKRICSDRYIKRYFSYSLPINDISDQEIEAIISLLNTASQEEIINSINTLITPQNSEALISKLLIFTENLPSDSSKQLALALSNFGTKLPNPKQFSEFNTPFSRGAMLISHLVENITPKEERFEFVNQIIEKSQPLTFASEIISWLRTDNSRYPNAFSGSEKDELANDLAKRIEKEANNGLSIFDEFPRQAPLLMTYWSTRVSSERANHYLQNFIEGNAKNIAKVLSSYLPTTYTLMTTDAPHLGDFERDQYNSLIKAFDPTIIYNELQRIYSNSLFSEEYPLNEFEDVNIRIASQFMWLHKYVESQSSEESATKDTHAK
ncbi:MAG: AAA family ATPase [Chloroflexi bacterium]|nr:AAA family ATPase [Chloroflexota bacterium]